MNQRELPKPGRGLRGWAHGNSGATRQEEVPLPGGFGADGPSSPRRTPPRLLAQPRAPPPPPRSPRPRGVRPRPAAPVSPPGPAPARVVGAGSSLFRNPRIRRLEWKARALKR